MYWLSSSRKSAVDSRLSNGIWSTNLSWKKYEPLWLPFEGRSFSRIESLTQESFRNWIASNVVEMVLLSVVSHGLLVSGTTSVNPPTNQPKVDQSTEFKPHFVYPWTNFFGLATKWCQAGQRFLHFLTWELANWHYFSITAGLTPSLGTCQQLLKNSVSKNWEWTEQRMKSRWLVIGNPIWVICWLGTDDRDLPNSFMVIEFQQYCKDTETHISSYWEEIFPWSDLRSRNFEEFSELRI